MTETSDAVGLLTRVRALRRKQTQVRTAGTLVLLLIFGTYGSCIYGLFSNFDQKRFTDTLAARADDTLGSLGKEFEAAAAHLLPVYSQAVNAKLEPGMRQLQERTSKELATLAEHLQTGVTARAERLQTGITSHVDRRLQERYPQLPKEARLRIRETMLADFERAALKRIQQRVEQPAKELTGLLETTISLSAQAKRQAKGQKYEPQERVLFSLLGVISRELIDQRALLQKELAN